MRSDLDRLQPLGLEPAASLRLRIAHGYDEVLGLLPGGAAQASLPLRRELQGEAAAARAQLMRDPAAAAVRAIAKFSAATQTAELAAGTAPG
jgi:hypothetical protein